MYELLPLANKRLVIIGCGYLGAAVARQALAAGMSVEALTRNPDRARDLTDAGARTVVDDLAAHTWHEHIAPREALVLNCVGSGGGGLEGYRHSYVEGMQSVTAWARRGPAATIVYTSSTSVYPQGNGQIVDETASTTEAGETGRILLESEALLRDAANACRRWVILRLAGIYGPDRHHLLDQVRAGATELPGSGHHHLNLAHRDDIVAAILASFSFSSERTGEIFNVADDAPATKAEVVAWLAGRLAMPCPRFSGGPASGRRGFVLPPDRIIANARLKAALGWRPRFPTFREGYAALLGEGSPDGGQA